MQKQKTSKVLFDSHASLYGPSSIDCSCLVFIENLSDSLFSLFYVCSVQKTMPPKYRDQYLLAGEKPAQKKFKKGTDSSDPTVNEIVALASTLHYKINMENL